MTSKRAVIRPATFRRWRCRPTLSAGSTPRCVSWRSRSLRCGGRERQGNDCCVLHKPPRRRGPAWAEGEVTENEVCYICCEPGADTDDHVIPACFFPSPRPSNLLTLRAHYSCHNRLDEEYVRNFMAAFGRDSSRSAARLWETEGAVRRSFDRNMPLRRSLIAGMMPRLEMLTPSGIYLGDAPGIRFDPKRVYPSLGKMVRGLYHNQTGRLLPPHAQFSWGLNEMLYGTLEEIFKCATPGLAYSDIFESRSIVEQKNGLEGVAWWLRFYQWTVFRCFVAPRPVSPDTVDRRGPKWTR